jgi:uncharacterized protein YndB with AHSA1/START domain
MATESTHVSAVIPASPRAVYEAWLSSELHTAMTGGAATIDPTVGGAHSAWHGYISGKTLELDPGKRIVQSWRTQEFLEQHGDSLIAVLFEEEGDHARVTIEHTEIPEGQGKKYEDGWTKHYFDPMIAHFSAAAPAAKKAAPRKAASKKAASKKAASKKAASKKAAPKKAAPKKAAAKKAAAKKAAPKKAAAKKPVAKKSAKKAVAKKAVAKKAAKKPAKRVVKKAAAAPPATSA